MIISLFNFFMLHTNPRFPPSPSPAPPLPPFTPPIWMWSFLYIGFRFIFPGLHTVLDLVALVLMVCGLGSVNCDSKEKKKKERSHSSASQGDCLAGDLALSWQLLKLHLNLSPQCPQNALCRFQGLLLYRDWHTPFMLS